VDKLVDILVDNNYEIPRKTSHCRESKWLKRQHGQKLSSPHNPMVEGSNPSPAILGG
jgi:hypothetical protein